jgi:hypothetical protein
MLLPAWVWVAVELAATAYLLSGPSGPSNGGSNMNAIDSVRNLPDSFFVALWSVADRLGTTPYILGLLLYEESIGINPKAQNSPDLSVACVGINQFCPGTYELFVSMPPADYLQLSAEEQLPYVAKYWASKPSAGLQSTRDLFWLSLTPVTWIPNASPDTVVNDPAKLGASYAAKVAKWNPAIATGDVITAGHIDAYLAGVAASPGWQLAMDRIAANAPTGQNAIERA